MNGNRNLFWKEVSNAEGGKKESCIRIKNRNGKFAEERMKCERSGRGILKFCIM